MKAEEKAARLEGPETVDGRMCRRCSSLLIGRAILKAIDVFGAG